VWISDVFISSFSNRKLICQWKKAGASDARILVDHPHRRNFPCPSLANWNLVGNWSTSNAGGLPQKGHDLILPSGAANLTNNNNLPVAVNTFNSITFSGGGYTLKGNQITLTNTVSVNATFVADTIALPMQLAGAAGSLQFFTTKEGPGTLILNADNSSFAGSFEVDNLNGPGILQIQNANALGSNGGNTRGGKQPRWNRARSSS
jgi:autotransporter-associated beta strand protein